MTPEELAALLDSLGNAADADARAEILSELSAEDLAAVRGELASTIRDVATAVRDGESENPEADMETVHAAQETLGVVRERITELESAQQAQADQAAAALDALGDDSDDDSDDGADDGEPAEPVADADGDGTEPVADPEPAEPVAEPQPEPVAASAQRRRGVSLGQVAQHRRRQPEPEPASPITLTASVAVEDADVRAGQRFNTPQSLGKAMGYASHSLGQGGKAKVAHADFKNQMRYNFGDRQGYGAWELVNQIRTEAERATRNDDGSLSYEGEVITASGGFCAPGTPIYDFFSVTSREGLLQLPSVTSERGAIEWPVSPGFPQLFGASGVATEWTNTNDQNPSDPATKPVFTPDCVTTQSCEVIAWATRLGFGTFQSMFYPEFVSHLTSESLMVHDHTVDIELLEDIEGLATLTQDLTGEVGSGTLINLSSILGYIGAWYRRKWRMPTSAVLDLLLPAWVRDAGAVDYIGRNGTVDFARARAAVDQALADLGFRVQWLANLGAELTPNTYWPQAEAVVFAPGTIVRQTAATLDLGVVRDTSTIDTNDFQTFVETFDSACLVGNEVVHLTGLDVCPTGETGALVAATCPTGESS